MKRSPSSPPSSNRLPTVEDDIKPPRPSNPKKGNLKAAPNGTPSSVKSRKTDTPHASMGIGEWTSEKKGKFMDEIIALGYKAANLDEMAQRLGLNKRQLINQLTTGRKNFRSLAVDAVRGD
ncbi:hypothetical protein I302_104102 [Kwoniella bestiolae CBS 10118]|uniref:Uncharacterized protein n=1 Tax=Kwoniella bestiolae CBS 10118 TaxID=1296100 RepID=A0A1B9GAC4_9TREE|nr:hypothetical protein I302_02810 [Kwoniella bestiolae CBS 10118]OCF27960.1 hypothetical protein I302_02810 [Kwoniella bestiolae CBS 10118]